MLSHELFLILKDRVIAIRSERKQQKGKLFSTSSKSTTVHQEKKGKKIENMPARASNRLRQAQQRRTATKGGGPRSPKIAAGAADNDDEDDALVLTGSCTLVIALIIIGIGAGLAVLFFKIHHPECMEGISFFPGGSDVAKVEAKTTTAQVRRRKLLLQEVLEDSQQQQQPQQTEQEGVVLIP